MKGKKESERKIDNRILSHLEDFTEEDVTDIFFSFDITPIAYLWEEKAHPGQEILASFHRKRLATKVVSVGELFVTFVKEFFSKPKNYAYLGIFVLIMVLIAYIRPLSIEAKDRLIAMLPPEIELPKPPPPPPPPPPPKEEPPPEPEKKEEPKPEPIPEEKLEKLKEEKERQLDELRDKLKSEKRQEDQYAGLKVPAARRDDVAPDLPSAFGNVKKRPGDDFPSSLSQIGTMRKGEPVPGYGKPLDIGASKAKRKDMGDTTLGAPIGEGVGKKPQEEQVSEDYRGRWIKIENLGPLAHLNSECYGKSYGEIIYRGPYKLKCGDNQILEAWRKE